MTVSETNGESKNGGVSWGETPTISRDETPRRSARPGLSSAPKYKSIRQQVSLTEKRFDVTTLPADIQRVYGHLAKDFGEEYALTFVFMVRTASELHRAWHMTLLTSKILQQVKEKFKIRTTWELGVIKLKFRVEDGGWELHRKVPYDYDSEFQDLYMKTAIALVEGHINIHQALIFQSETKHGKHTASSGLFLRDFPGRLVLYPLEAATCAVIFFSGDWYDAAVAAVAGLTAGLVEYALTTIGGDAKVLIDVLVGVATGAVGGLFYRFGDENVCLSAVFLGTLYWFFYGTAFVIGILEIVAGELETGVTRFMAVSVKTFVLTLGATFGMKITVENSLDAWLDQRGNCGNIDLDAVWWRIPLYLLCSASALGQYRFPLNHYWRGLIVQLIGYEVQYRVFNWFALQHDQDFLDTASANVLGAMAAVVTANLMSYIVDKLSYYYNARLLQRNVGEFSAFGNFMYNFVAGYIRLTNAIGIGRKTDLTFLNMEGRLKQQSSELLDPNHSRSEITLDPEEENILLQAIVGAENLNVWSLLMPTVYQLVPGSLIARLWFNSVFPPPLLEVEKQIRDTEFTYTTLVPDVLQEAVFQNLMVIATSLALGLLLGSGVVSLLNFIFSTVFALDKDKTLSQKKLQDRRYFRQGVLATDPEDDPESDDEVDPVVQEEEEKPFADEEEATDGLNFESNKKN